MTFLSFNIIGVVTPTIEAIYPDEVGPMSDWTVEMEEPTFADEDLN